MRRLTALVLGGLVLFSGAALAAAPNDPGWSQQWHLAKIRADKAWARSKGAGVIVAVVDTGVDLQHPDLQGRLVSGKDYVDGGSPQDDNGHGTFMAGLVAAATSNGVGVASVAPSAKIMPIKALAQDGSGNVDDVADGIRWAVDHGADVINLSLAQENIGGGGSGPQNLLGNPLLDLAIKDAANDGALVVVASGNNFSEGGSAETAYDARVAGVLVVGASTRSDRRAGYSNYGAGLDILAPGGGSVSDPAAQCKDNNPVLSTFWDPKTQDSGYGAGCGTSMAVAHVSGVGALLIARGYSGASAAKRITSTAVDLGPAGRDNTTGYGRVDALAAVGGTSTPSQPPTNPSSKTKVKKKVTTAASPAATPSVNGSRIAAPSVTPSPSPSHTGLLAAENVQAPRPSRAALVAIAATLALVSAAGHLGRRYGFRARQSPLR